MSVGFGYDTRLTFLFTEWPMRDRPARAAAASEVA